MFSYFILAKFPLAKGKNIDATASISFQNSKFSSAFKVCKSFNLVKQFDEGSKIILLDGGRLFLEEGSRVVSSWVCVKYYMFGLHLKIFDKQNILDKDDINVWWWDRNCHTGFFSTIVKENILIWKFALQLFDMVSLVLHKTNPSVSIYVLIQNISVLTNILYYENLLYYGNHIKFYLPRQNHWTSNCTLNIPV